MVNEFLCFTLSCEMNKNMSIVGKGKPCVNTTRVCVGGDWMVKEGKVSLFPIFHPKVLLD